MGLDTAESLRHLSALRRWILFGALLLLGAIYLSAFALFVSHSEDFFVARHNREAVEFAAQHPVKMPATIRFQSGSPLNGLLGGGWHKPEPHGVWSSSTDSWIALTLQSGTATAILRLNASPFLSRRTPRATITLTINDKDSQCWERNMANASEPLEIHLSHEALQTRHLKIHIHLQHLTSPFAVYAGPDHRPLGVLLSSMAISDEHM